MRSSPGAQIPSVPSDTLECLFLSPSWKGFNVSFLFVCFPTIYSKTRKRCTLLFRNILLGVLSFHHYLFSYVSRDSKEKPICGELICFYRSMSLGFCSSQILPVSDPLQGHYRVFVCISNFIFEKF